MTPGQLWAVIVFFAALVGSAFAAGMWVDQIRSQLDTNKQASKMKSDYDKELAEASATLKTEATKERESVVQAAKKEQDLAAKKLRFLTYYYAFSKALLERTGAEDIAQKTFTSAVKSMREEWLKNEQNGQPGLFIFVESEAHEHRIVFSDKSAYIVPHGIKGKLLFD
jgi:hypothetical protein